MSTHITNKRRQSRGLRRDADASQERILDAALMEFAEKGFAGARLGAIAKAAQADTTLIHYYFGDKNTLYGQVLLGATDEPYRLSVHILDRIPKAHPKTGRFSSKITLPAVREIIDDAVTSLLRLFAQQPHVIALLRRDAREGGTSLARIVERTSKPLFDAVVRYLEAAARRRVVRTDVDMQHLFLSVMAMCAFPSFDREHVALLWAVDPGSRDFRDARHRDVVETTMARLTP